MSRASVRLTPGVKTPDFRAALGTASRHRTPGRKVRGGRALTKAIYEMTAGSGGGEKMSSRGQARATGF
jgi:hypothetical protein